MRVSTSWVKEWLSRTMSDEAIVEALELAGVEVEQYIAPTMIDKNVVVGLVKKVVQHPGADRLHLVKVTTGEQEFSIVCGAPNVRENMKVALAQIGTTLPDGMVIKQSKLRGELSEGMLCSEHELGLGSNHDGILELGSEAVLGASLCDIYENHGIVDVKTAANRPDLQSVVGLSREVAALSKNELRDLVEPKRVDGDGPKAVIEADSKLVGRFMVAEFSLGASKRIDTKLLETIGTRLLASGLRPLSPVVDVTNYVMLEYGQPLHAYDADKVSGVLGCRLARDGETLITLDSVKRVLTSSDLVITDGTGAIGLAGVMGGQSTEVTAATTRIYLEAASFDGASVRKTAQRLGLRSEASARFERGLPVELPPFGMARATELIGLVAGAEQTAGVTDLLRVWPWTQRIGLKLTVLNQLLGYEISREEAVSALQKLQIQARPFDIVAEAKSHLGKPYVWGASYRTHGTDAFDCGYLVDYLYSLIGQMIGHSAPQLMQSGREIDLSELRIGDTLYRDGIWEKVERDERDGVSHVGMYIGNGEIIHAESHELVDGKWQEIASHEQNVRIDKLEVITKAPGFYGARRHVENLDDYIAIPAVPWWRPDLKIAEDIVEEIVRVLGYDRVPSTIPVWRPKHLQFDRGQSLRTKIKNLLSGAGLFEIMTYSFVGQDQLAAVGLNPAEHLKLQNPLSSEQAYLRSSLLPSHLQVLARNRTYGKNLGFFELSKVFLPADGTEQPYEPLRLAILIARPKDSYRKIKGMLDVLSQELNVELKITANGEALGFATGRSAQLSLGKKAIGNIGQLDPAILRRDKIAGEAAYLEIDIEPVLAAVSTRQFAGLNRFPGTSRDITILVKGDVTWSSVHGVLSGIRHTLVTYVGEYAGEKIPSGHRSLTVRLTLSFPDRTPTDGEAQRMEALAWAELERKFGIKA